MSQPKTEPIAGLPVPKAHSPLTYDWDLARMEQEAAAFRFQTATKVRVATAAVRSQLHKGAALSKLLVASNDQRIKKLIAIASGKLGVSPTSSFGAPLHDWNTNAQVVYVKCKGRTLTINLPVDVEEVTGITRHRDLLRNTSEALHSIDVLSWDIERVQHRYGYDAAMAGYCLQIDYRDPFLGTLSIQGIHDEPFSEMPGRHAVATIDNMVRDIMQEREVMFAKMLSTIDITLEKRHAEDPTTNQRRCP